MGIQMLSNKRLFNWDYSDFEIRFWPFLEFFIIFNFPRHIKSLFIFNVLTSCFIEFELFRFKPKICLFSAFDLKLNPKYK